MFWWTDRYHPVAVPNFDQVGTPPYYALLVIRQLTVFSVPAFLFVSGFFSAYAVRSSKPASSWKIARARLYNLIVPYLVWSAVIFLGDVLQGLTWRPSEYLKRLALGGADPVYFYVPLLSQFYLLSPLVVPVAKTRGRWLLFASALLQLGTISLQYLSLLGKVQAPILGTMRVLTSSRLFVNWAFFFALGVVSGFHRQQLKRWLTRYKWCLLVAVVVLGSMMVVESEIVYRLTGKDWRGGALISGNLYAVAFLLCFVAFHRVSIRFSGILYQLSRRSYGIYLLHHKVIEFVARAIRQIVPWMLAYQALYQPVLVVFGVGAPLLFMAAVAKGPARRAFRYLFG